MPTYPFHRLLRIRTLRAQTAHAAAARCRLRLAEAERLAASAEEVWRTYRRQRPEREAALFENIRGRAVDRDGMDRYQEARMALSARELELEDAAKQANRKAGEARAALDEAQAALLAANRQVRKFKEHRCMWKEEQRRAADAAAESEQEDRPLSVSRFHEAR